MVDHNKVFYIWQFEWPEADHNTGILENKLIYKFDHLPAGLFNRSQVHITMSFSLTHSKIRVLCCSWHKCQAYDKNNWKTHNNILSVYSRHLVAISQANLCVSGPAAPVLGQRPHLEAWVIPQEKRAHRSGTADQVGSLHIIILHCSTKF